MEVPVPLSDPDKVPFEDRKEIYLESIETKYFPEIEQWYTANKPRFDAQFENKSEDNDASAVANVKKTSDTGGCQQRR